MANERLEVAIVEDGSGTKQLIEAVNKLAAGIDDLGLKAKKGASSVKEQGDAAKKSANDNGYLERALGGTKSAMGGLQSALAGVTSLLSVSKLIDYADKYQSMSGKLRLVTTDQTKLNGIIEQAYGIAQRNSTGLQTTTELYGKLSSTVQALGGNQKDVAGLTETVTQAIALTGATAEEAKNGLTQFNQGLSSGALRGDEFNSVLENIPGLAKAIAAGIGVSGAITTGELRKMAEEGKLTGKTIVEALKKVAPEIKTLAAGMPDSVSKAFTRLDNAFLKFIGQSNQAYGVTGLLAKGIDLITNNINLVVPALLTFTALLAAGALAGAVNAIAGVATGFVTLAGAVGTATIAMLSNPLILAGTLITIAAVIAAVKLSGKTFGELAVSAGSGAQGLALGVAKALGLTTALAGVPGAASSATAAIQANGNANAVAAQAQTANTAATSTAAAGLPGFVAGLVSQAAAVNNSIAAKTAETTATTANTAAKVAALPAQEASNKSVFEGIDAQTRIGQALRNVTAAAPQAAAGLTSVGSSATTMGAGLNTGSNGVLQVKNGFDALSGSTVKASGSFGEITKASTGALPGFASVNQAAGETSAKFLEVSMYSNRLNLSVNAVANSAKAAGPAMSGLGSATRLTRDEIDGIIVAMGGEVSSLASLGDGTGAAKVAAYELAKANGTLGDSMKATGDAAKDALDKITAQAKATEDASKAAKEYADRLEKLSGNYNQLGEKLETYQEMLTRVTNREREHTQYVAQLIAKLSSAEGSTSSLSSATSSLSSAQSQASSSTSSLSTSLQDNTSAYYTAAGGVKAYSDALSQSVIAAADATAAYNADRASRASDNGYNSSVNKTVSDGLAGRDGGQFGVQTSGYEVTFNGKTIGDFTTGSVSGAKDAFLANSGIYVTMQENIQRAIDAAAKANPSLTTVQASAIAQKVAAQQSGAYGTLYNPKFAHGTEFKVGGNGGTDSQPVAFMASPNETVIVETPAQRNKRLSGNQRSSSLPTSSGSQRPGVFIMNVRTNDVDSYKRTRTQLAQDMVRRLNK